LLAVLLAVKNLRILLTRRSLPKNTLAKNQSKEAVPIFRPLARSDFGFGGLFFPLFAPIPFMFGAESLLNFISEKGGLSGGFAPCPIPYLPFIRSCLDKNFYWI